MPLNRPDVLANTVWDAGRLGQSASRTTLTLERLIHMQATVKCSIAAPRSRT